MSSVHPKKQNGIGQEPKSDRLTIDWAINADEEELDIQNEKLLSQTENARLIKEIGRLQARCQALEKYVTGSREIYLLAIEASNLGIFDTEVRDRDYKLKENWLARLGYDPTLARDEEGIWETLIHPDDKGRVVAEIEKEEKGEIDSLVLEYRIRAADGNYRWILESSKSIGTIRENGKYRLVGTHYDITERKLAEEAQREQRAFADALSETTAVFNRTLNLNEVLSLILENVEKVVPHDDSDIWLIDKKLKRVHPALRKGMDGKVMPASAVIIPVEEIKVFQEIIETRQPVYLPEIQPDTCPIPSRNPNSRSCVCTPVVFGDFLLGFLVLNSSVTNYFTARQIERLQAFSNQAAVAIRNAQLFSQAQEAAALEERQRLAREMHDVISQTLFSATIKAEALPYLIETEPREKIKENLIELHKLTRGALAEMRTMLMELRPNSIVNTDLSNLLRQMVEGLAGRTTAEILLQTEGVGLLPPEVQTAFFRITQEAINNILKHSKADRVTITYKNQKTMAYLCIEDNGCGFDPENVMVERMGVRIMRERAESINALFELTSMQTCGTKIEVNWIKPQSE